MERAIVTLESLGQLTDDRHLYIVREDDEQPALQHDTKESQLDEWLDVMHRLQEAEQQRA